MIAGLMPIRLIHLVDEHTGEDAARLCSLLLRKLPAGEVSQQVILMGQVPATLNLSEEVRAARVARPRVWPFMSAMPLQRKLRQENPDAVIAWSGFAYAAANAVWTRAMVGVIDDPGEARDSSRWMRAVERAGLELICTNGTVQRRLIEAGRPLESTGVIRPGVDFAEIRRARESMSRETLGLPASGRIMLTTSPASRRGGQYYAAWAAAILHHIWPDAALIVPGVSREQQRIGRLVENIYCPQAFFLTGNRYSPAELLAVADALLVPALDDASMGWVAWAMAAGVPIIGSAVPCVTEFVVDRENGFLCRAGQPHALAVRIRTAFESPELMAHCVQTARHQAYETFRTERCVDEFLKVIRNLAGGQRALTGVLDAAVDA